MIFPAEPRLPILPDPERLHSEEWRAVPGYPGIDASTLGRIRRPDVHGQKRILLLALGSTGYVYVRLGDRRSYRLNRLVTLAFHGRPPSRRHQSAHGDGDRLNNRPSNLRWASPKENTADRIAHRTTLSGESHPCSLISAQTAEAIRHEYTTHEEIRRSGGFARVRRGFLDHLAKKFAVSKYIVCDIVTGRSWNTLNRGQTCPSLDLNLLKTRLKALNNQIKQDRETIRKSLHARRPIVNGKSSPSYDEMAQLLRYCPKSGRLFWKIDRPKAKAGNHADTLIVQGYRVVNVLGQRYAAHRVAWLLHYGEWPSLMIDHRDGIKSNNRLRNLRQATHSQNNANVGPKKNSRTGIKGVFFEPRVGLYYSTIKSAGKTIHLGWYDDPVKAQTAFRTASLSVHGEFAWHAEQTHSPTCEAA